MDRVPLTLIFIHLIRLNQSQLRCHGEMRHRAIDNQLVQFILEEIFFDGDRPIKIVYVHL